MNKDITQLLGRILIAILFVPAGWGKLMGGFAGTVGYVASKGLPMPQVLAAGAIFCELFVGLALLVGFKTRWAALLLALFTVVAALFFHNFWAMSDVAAAATNKINFFKNLAIAGGLLFVYVAGPGRYSVDKA
ncbi:MAG: DoxX family protein [Betaproteobacteria bacterium]